MDKQNDKESSYIENKENTKLIEDNKDSEEGNKYIYFFLYIGSLFLLLDDWEKIECYIVIIYVQDFKILEDFLV